MDALCYILRVDYCYHYFRQLNYVYDFIVMCVLMIFLCGRKFIIVHHQLLKDAKFC